MTTVPLKRQEVVFNLDCHIDSWTLDLGNGVLIITKSLTANDLEHLTNTGKLDFPEEIVMHFQSGYAMILTLREDSEPAISSIFTAVDGDVGVDVVFDIAEVQYISVPAIEE
jgi:hypothetical protein